MIQDKRKISNKIHLITYADSLGGDLKSLKNILDKYFKKEIWGVHILPFYPSTTDRGFSPSTYERVDPMFGDWKDIDAISSEYELTCDLMVNHISGQSKQFQDFLKNGPKSKYADWFVTAEKFSRRIEGTMRQKINGRLLSFLENLMNHFRKLDIFFHKYGVNRLALRRIFRPRSGSPFVSFDINGYSKKNVWCTFSKDQIDLDIRNSEVTKMLEEAIERFCEHGAQLIRLDAVGYIGKKRGTSNFLIPESYAYIEKLASVAHSQGAKILPEIRYHHKIQLDLSRRPGVDFVYDFCFPTLLLHSFLSGKNKYLKQWLRIRPENSVSVLDTHDGIGMVDVKGILSQNEMKAVIKDLEKKGANPLMRSLGQRGVENEVYQMNITFYDALGKNDDAYLAARTFQFFLPGIQQIYYVGLLAGENDYEKYEKSGVGRDVNRRNYQEEEVRQVMSKEIVKRLLKLMRFRNTYPAFQGSFEILKSAKNKMRLKWKKGKAVCEANINLKTKKASIFFYDFNQKKRIKYVP